MAPSASAAAPSGTPKKERLEARLTAEQKATIQRAAHLLGQSITDFVISSAEAAAEKLIRERDILTLSAETSRLFAEALLNPPVPNETLRTTIARYRDAVGDE